MIPLSLFTGLYGAAWQLARPVLRRHKRLSQGFEQRLAPQGWAGPQGAHCWVQAASGGEAYLVRQLVQELSRLFPVTGPVFNLLCTSCTRQGLDVLEGARDWAEVNAPQLRVTPRFFPLDQPSVMCRALSQVRPGLVLLLETELWPGLLLACAEQGVPVALVNGRMRERSLRGYKKLTGLWAAAPPQRVLAISPEDAARFAALFGPERVGVMPNMKFDALKADEGGAATLPVVFPQGAPRIVLGSVRKEEELLLPPVLQELHKGAPGACIVLAPRHLERADAWEQRLRCAGLPYLRRSGLNDGESLPPGHVLLWDRFGELRGLYAGADAVFVGGSLAPLGGQNFLEPLSAGVIPLVGPDFSNFAWVGEELFSQGLARVVPDASRLAGALLEQLENPVPRQEVRERFTAYLAPRQGGSRLAAQTLLGLAGNGFFEHTAL